MTMIDKRAGVILLLLLFFHPLSVQPMPTPSFPIGLTLTYEAVDEYFMGPTLHSTESFEVLSWLTSDNSSFQLRRGYSEGDDMTYSIRNVSYPSWDYTVYDEDINETVDGAMYPLWIDITNWERDQNVSIGLGTYITHTFTIISNEEIKVGEISIYCWVLECKFVDANDWDITIRQYYDFQYGILIKHYYHRYPGPQNPANIGTFTDTLVASNILDELASYASILHGYTLTNLLIIGIVIEIFIIIALIVIRRLSVSSGAI